MLGRTSDTDAEIVKGLGDGDRVLVRDPLPGEVEAIGWDETLLTEAGYILDENGKPALPMRGMPDGMPAIVPAAMPQGGQPAGGEGRQGGRQRPTGGTGGGSGGGQAGTQSNAAPAAKGG
jgi:hypothetical protein